MGHAPPRDKPDRPVAFALARRGAGDLVKEFDAIAKAFAAPAAWLLAHRILTLCCVAIVTQVVLAVVVSPAILLIAGPSLVALGLGNRTHESGPQPAPPWWRTVSAGQAARTGGDQDWTMSREEDARLAYEKGEVGPIGFEAMLEQVIARWWKERNEADDFSKFEPIRFSGEEDWRFDEGGNLVRVEREPEHACGCGAELPSHLTLCAQCRRKKEGAFGLAQANKSRIAQAYNVPTGLGGLLPVGTSREAAMQMQAVVRSLEQRLAQAEMEGLLGAGWTIKATPGPWAYPSTDAHVGTLMVTAPGHPMLSVNVFEAALKKPGVMADQVLMRILPDLAEEWLGSTQAARELQGADDWLYGKRKRT